MYVIVGSDYMWVWIRQNPDEPQAVDITKCRKGFQGDYQRYLKK